MGLLAHDYPQLRIDNRARDGAKFSDVLAQLGSLSPADRYDLVLVQAGGNVGNAPFFFPPLSWLMTQRARDMHRFVHDSAAAHGAAYVNLFHERDDDPFVLRPELNASDGLHPSDARYRVWFDQLMSQADLAGPLAAARSSR